MSRRILIIVNMREFSSVNISSEKKGKKFFFKEISVPSSLNGLYAIRKESGPRDRVIKIRIVEKFPSVDPIS